MFPTLIHYQRNDSPGWKIRDWDTANKLLGYLDPQVRPFAVFTLPNNSYAQCLGSKRRLTVEVREYAADGSFTHWVFGRGPLSGHSDTIEVSTGAVTVDTSQLLTMRDARLIIRPFLELQSFPTTYSRHDVTARFALNRNA